MTIVIVVASRFMCNNCKTRVYRVGLKTNQKYEKQSLSQNISRIRINVLDSNLNRSRTILDGYQRQEFKYLGIILKDKNNIHGEVNTKFNTDNRRYYLCNL